jgi:two-component system phosphate regulon sensor histidine kinase PhoR
VGVSDRRAISRALDQIRRRGPSSGRQTFRIDDVSVLAQWRADGDNVAAFLLPPTLVSDWVHQALPADFASADAVLIADESGSAVVGTKPDNSTGLATRLATATGLPWNVTLKPIATSSADMAALAGRSRLLVTGLAAIVILLSGGGYILWRGVRREVALARIQTDFVAAVSHEFRTPLTSLQHVTELLDEDDELPREDKRTLYASLGRSTDRLRGLVESLLDFARMEEGRRPYDLRPLDVSSLARDVVADFTRHAPAGARITLDTPSSGPVYCRADAAALKHAAWNLLDNAVKYSPEPHLVRVSVKEEEGAVAIAVADQGYGIPAGERRSVFDKFVRGSSAQGRGIKGTGLGLALVSHIVAAHHGTLDLQSEEGKGSTFTIILPCLAS